MTTSLDQMRASIIGLLPRLRRFARAITRNHEDADDLVEISVERALQRYVQWRPDSRLEGWLFGLMRTTWIDEVRARQRRDRGFVPAARGEPASTDESRPEAPSAQTALLALPDEQRMAVALVLIEELSYREAAEALELPVDTLTSRLARGREALQALL
jgi:RNA polymerase sigma-70 factor, ECF subfamily